MERVYIKSNCRLDILKDANVDENRAEKRENEPVLREGLTVSQQDSEDYQQPLILFFFFFQLWNL
jgi:hypothetical protein